MFSRTRSAEVNGRQYPVVHLRHVGRWIVSAVCLAIFAWLVQAYWTNPNLEWSEVWRYLFDDRILSGISVTILLSIVATVVGLVLGTILAIMVLSHNPVARTLATLYIWFFRGTPVLVQLIFWYNLAFLFPSVTLGIPGTSLMGTWSMNTLMTGFNAAILGLGLNLAAYAAEIVRAGIQAVDVGQTEAAYAVGMTRKQRMNIIVLPQALRIIIPPLGNEFISMLKTTSLVYVIAGADLMTRSAQIYRQNMEVIELLIVASIWYMVMTAIATVFQSRLERRMARSDAGRRKAPKVPHHQAAVDDQT